MITLIAAIIGILVIFGMWRFLDPNNDKSATPPPQITRPQLPKFPVRRRQVAPDDNPEFLRELNRKLPKKQGNGPAGTEGDAPPH